MRSRQQNIHGRNNEKSQRAGLFVFGAACACAGRAGNSPQMEALAALDETSASRRAEDEIIERPRLRLQY